MFVFDGKPKAWPGHGYALEMWKMMSANVICEVCIVGYMACMLTQGRGKKLREE